MIISGFVKNSFVDYPGKMASVIFLPRCNMACPWCHNKHILSGNIPIIDENEIFDYLAARRGLLDGVVVTGGEPTLSGGLPAMLEKIKALGYAVKLDTNGTNPEALHKIINAGLANRVAMDIKAPLGKYKAFVGFGDTDKIKESISLLKSSGIEYEFRTTFEPRLSRDDILEMAALLFPMEGKYFIQQYRQVEGCPAPLPNSVIRAAADAVCAEWGDGCCQTRGI